VEQNAKHVTPRPKGSYTFATSDLCTPVRSDRLPPQRRALLPQPPRRTPRTHHSQNIRRHRYRCPSRFQDHGQDPRAPQREQGRHLPHTQCAYGRMAAPRIKSNYTLSTKLNLLSQVVTDSPPTARCAEGLEYSRVTGDALQASQ
jgi:hypothetical protein